ncbi:ABC transporter [Xylariales sp. PMI_506]|nr:ABC transporter [Xylariales sp. PMI_506]
MEAKADPPPPTEITPQVAAAAPDATIAVATATTATATTGVGAADAAGVSIDAVSTPSENAADTGKPPERVPVFGDYLRVFTYATKWDFVIYVIAAIASLGAGVTMPLMNIIFGQLVGQFSSFFAENGSITIDDFHRLLNRQALYLTALFLVRWGLSSINQFCFRMIGIRLSSAVRRDYLRALFAQPIHVLDSIPAGAPATAITTTSNTLQMGISERLGTFLQFNATIWAALVIAFVWSWDLTLVTASLILYIVAVLSITLPLILKSQTATIQADAQATAVASEALEGIRLVMACGAQTRIISRYNEHIQDALKKSHKMAPITGAQLGLIFFGVFGAFGLAFWYGIKRFIDGAISNAGVVVVVLMSVMMILTSLERVSTPIIAVGKAVVAACEFFTVIDAPLPPAGTLRPEDINKDDVVFQDVTFEYPSRPGVRILDALNFRIRNGETTALVGPSGSGKSTIVGLIEGWYSLRAQHVIPKVTDQEKSEESAGKPVEHVEPKLSGSISVGGHNLEDLDIKWWRRQIGLVQQEPFLFNDTIFGNVVKGLIGTEWEDATDEDKKKLVEEACQEAYAHEFIIRLPDGYNSRVGDGGAKLSGGQKQRLAIARSIVKKPRIIILDEATSAIDTKSEKIVQAALDKITETRTTLVIAHRLSTIKKADHIIVLQRGKLAEEGTHQSLMDNPNGVYSGLVHAQSLKFAQDGEEDSEAPGDASGPDDAQSEQREKLHRTSTHASSIMPADPEAGQDPQSSPKARNMAFSFGEILYEQRRLWPWYVGTLIAAIACGAGTPIQAWLFAQVVNVFLLQGDDLRQQSTFWGLMWLALAGGVGLAYFFQTFFSMHLQFTVSTAYKLKYTTDMLYQKLSFFDQDDNSHGSLSSRISSDAKQLEEMLGINLAFFLSGIFTIIGCIVISLSFGWKLGLVAMFVTMPIMIGGGLFKFRNEVQFDKMNAQVFMESSQFATEAIGAIRTVSALSLEDSINRRYSELLEGHVQAARRKAQWMTTLFGFADSVSLGCQALIFWYGGGLLASGEYSLISYFVSFMAIIQGAESAGQVLAVAPSAAQATEAANRILNIRKTTQQHTLEHDGSIPDSDGGVQIELRKISFKYPTRDYRVFNGLSLTIEKGQYAAFVGPSGCGKTTIVSLLERFYDVDKGAILCNGVNIKDLGVYKYRENLSLVSQEPTLFRGTVRDNILFGIKDPSSISDEQIHQVCRDAFIHDFIMSLPEGYNTAVGTKGVSMSGGQKQRIAIARALIRNPKVLLLDEATSALDSESEKSVQAAFEKARHGRTMIAIAHRLSTIQNADVIFVFDQGKVIEKGSHSELLAKRGAYWDMCQSQALDQ